MENLEFDSGVDSSSGDKLLSIEDAMQVMDQFNKLTDSLQHYNECLNNLAHSLKQEIYSYIMKLRLSAFRMETRYALKHYNASFFTKWYYWKKYRKFRYERIRLERLIRNIQ